MKLNQLICASAILFVVTAATPVLADNTPNANLSNSPGDANNVIGAQIDVTQAAVTQMLQQLNSRKPSGQFHIADYKAMEPAIQSKLQQGLMLFEFELQHSIMKKLKFWMDRYNSIYSSPDFSTAQKAAILKHQLDIVKSQVQSIDKEYQNDIMRVYGLAGDLPYDFRISELYSGGGCSNDSLPGDLRDKFGLQHPWHGCRRYDIVQPVQFLTGVDTKIVSSEILDEGYSWIADSYVTNATTALYSEDGTHYCISNMGCYSRAEILKYYPNQKNVYLSFWDGTNNIWRDDVPPAIKSVVAQKYITNVFPILSQGCRSQLCVGLRAGDVSFFLSLVNTDIDKTLTVSLKDGARLQLVAPKLDLTMAQTFLDVTTYPVNLPFDTN